MEFPLSGVRILDLTLLMAGPYCTLILGDLGAEVMKIETPGVGEAGRGVPPHFFEGESAYFIAMNRNKKSITLNLRTDEGRDIFYALAKKSDVVIDNFRPGVLKRLGADYESLKAVNPRIISCSITGYGQTGALNDGPASDLTIQARGGIMSYTGEPGRMPVKMGAPIGGLAGGIFAAHGILAALYQRERTGRGQQVDVSLLDCQISLLTYRGQYYFVGNEIAQPVGSGHASTHPVRAFKTKTFDIVVDCNTQKVFVELCGMIGRPELAENPKFRLREDRYKNKEELYSILEELFLSKSGEEWMELLEERIPISPINTVDRALVDPQVLSRNMVVEVEYPNGKRLKILGNPIKMSEIKKQVFSVPPQLGEHTDKVLKDYLGYSNEEIQRLKTDKII